MLSTVVEHKFTSVVLSGVDYDTMLNNKSSKSDTVMISRLVHFLNF